MKRLLTAILILAMLLPAAALSDLPDISWLSYEELIQLKEQITLAIWDMQEWHDVVVPAGFYVVGEDIPAGHWTIKYSPGEYSLVEYFLTTDATGKRPADIMTDYYYEGVCDPTNIMASSYKLKEFDLDLKAGYHVVINYGSVIFTQFTGRYSPFK